MTPLSAGFQNGSLLEKQQPHGYASLVAAQARVPLVKVKKDDPLVPPAAGRPAGHGHISGETARSMRELMSK